jgi:hypothetical protein
MSDRINQVVKDLTEFLTIAEQSVESDETALREATERIAILIGDNGLKPGDMVRLKNGTVYHVEPAFFFENEEVNTGQLFCRNWHSLETMDTVISDAEAHLRRGEAPLPLVYDEQPPEAASIEERKAFVRELPELAAKLRELALKKRNPSIGEAAKLAEKMARAVQAEIGEPELPF